MTFFSQMSFLPGAKLTNHQQSMHPLQELIDHKESVGCLLRCSDTIWSASEKTIHLWKYVVKAKPAVESPHNHRKVAQDFSSLNPSIEALSPVTESRRNSFFSAPRPGNDHADVVDKRRGTLYIGKNRENFRSGLM
jgi:hypothetical protein